MRSRWIYDRLLRRHIAIRQGLFDFRQPFLGNAASAEAKSFQVCEVVLFRSAGVCDPCPSKVEYFKVSKIAEVVSSFVVGLGITQIQLAEAGQPFDVLRSRAPARNTLVFRGFSSLRSVKYLTRHDTA